MCGLSTKFLICGGSELVEEGLTLAFPDHIFADDTDSQSVEAVSEAALVLRTVGEP